MEVFKKLLAIDLPKEQSTFLWGGRERPVKPPCCEQNSLKASSLSSCKPTPFLNTPNHHFYLFDPGVAGAITRRTVEEEKGKQFGNAFEHFIYLEMLAHSSYHEIEKDALMKKFKVTKG